MYKQLKNSILQFVVIIFVPLLFSCNGTKFLDDNELLLVQNRVVSMDPTVSVGNLKDYIQQKPNTKWFSTLNVPLGIYSMSGKDTTKAVNRLLRKAGEAPVALDYSKVEVSCINLRTMMNNRGYLDTDVSYDVFSNNRRAKVWYKVTPNEQYYIRSISYRIADSYIDSLLHQNNVFANGLKAGQVFSVNALNAERNRITEWLNNRGYLFFNKENITFLSDSSQIEKCVDVTMNIGLYRRSSSEDFHNHNRYTIRNVTYETSAGQELKIRNRTLDMNTLLMPSELYSSENLQKTYKKFARLYAVRSTNIHFEEVEDSIKNNEHSSSDYEIDKQIDVRINVARKKTHSIQLQPEGTNTAGDLGAALSLTYENRNVFHGSEMLTLQARGAFEAIRGLEGYQAHNYEEYGIESRLAFPEFVIPGISRKFQRRHNAISELLLSYNIQNRPEFHRRVLTAGWRYKWSASSRRINYQFDFLDIDYVSMPWISDTFKHDYLDSVSNRNAILRYNYENLLITKMGFSVSYNDGENSLKLNLETSGNVLSAVGNLFGMSKNELGQYKIANIAFAQYVKFDADYTRLLKLDYRNSLALHARIGVAVPYGNSTMLPYEKRYFAGGANSVRGWSVRSLGPGRFSGKDGRIDFINHTGDVKIDLNAELRTNLFWKFQGALFIDAGNLWTLKDYKDQPGGQITLKGIYQEMAVAYGVGLRLNFDYFILRLDMGMKAINPDYTTTREHFPITNHDFGRDYALHFAVGLPF